MNKVIELLEQHTDASVVIEGQDGCEYAQIRTELSLLKLMKLFQECDNEQDIIFKERYTIKVKIGNKEVYSVEQRTSKEIVQELENILHHEFE